MKRPVLIALFAILAIVLASPCIAAQESKAKAAFDQGVTHFKNERYEDAAAEFRRAYELHPTWKLLFNIGQCEAALKRYGLALDAFEAYLVDGGDEISVERQAEVQKEIDRLMRLSGELVLEAPAGAEVWVDGRKRATAPVPGPMRIAAGMHQIQIKRGGAVLLDEQVRITGRGKSTVKALPQGSSKGKEALAATDETQEEEPAESEGTSTVTTWGWVLGGTGAALAIAGAVTGGVATSKHGELESACPDKTCHSKSDYELRDQVDSLKLATDVLLPVGGAMVAAGIIMIVYGSRQEKETALSVSPAFARGEGGLFVEGRF